MTQPTVRGDGARRARRLGPDGRPTTVRRAGWLRSPWLYLLLMPVMFVVSRVLLWMQYQIVDHRSAAEGCAEPPQGFEVTAFTTWMQQFPAGVTCSQSLQTSWEIAGDAGPWEFSDQYVVQWAWLADIFTAGALACVVIAVVLTVQKRRRRSALAGPR